MNLTKKLDSVQYLTDSGGNKKAVVVDLATWETLMALLKELEGAIAIDQLVKALQDGDEESTPWEKAQAEYIAAHPDIDLESDEADERHWMILFSHHPEVLERLAAEARVEEEAGRTRELLIDSVMGKYAFVQTSSDEFTERKQQEIDLEERPR